jgi:hypothetical protein
MTSQGSAVARLRRSLDGGHLMMAEIAARELPRVPLVDALRLCLLMQAVGDERYDRAVARWIGRFVAECQSVGLGDLQAAIDVFEALPDPDAKKEFVGLLARHGSVLRI